MKVLIAGGGTAGHINPGIAIAKFIKQKHPDSEILFVGTQKGLETKLVPREGFELKVIKVRGFKRKLSLDTFVAVKELCQGIMEARKVIKEFGPDVVIGTGGYVCGPVVFNAAMMKIPTVIHESNAFPGITNRILARFVDAVAISFKDSRKYFKAAKQIILTGNPVRDEMLHTNKHIAREKLEISPNKLLALIFCGSRGAETVNAAVVEMLTKHYKGNDFSVIYATGDLQYEKISSQLEGSKHKELSVVPYIYDMANSMAAADLVVCRAGAITISELTALGIPSVMIPSPYVTANHQEANARALEEQGAAVVIVEKNLSGGLLYRQITSLLEDKDQLGKMAKNAKKTGVTDAAEKVYSIIIEVTKPGK